MDAEKNKKEIVILLTACVNPNGMSYTILQNAAIREEQYLHALKFYLKETALKIVLVENTLYSLPTDWLGYADKQRFEYLTFDGNTFDKNLGKGYGEAMIIQHACKHSRFISEASCIIKITGRLIVKNIVQLIGQARQMNKKNMILCNQVNHLEGCPSEIVMFSKSFYPLFWENAIRINDSRGIAFEHVLAHTIKEARNKGFCYHTYKYPVELSGQSASTGKFYAVHPRTIHFIKCRIKYYKSRWGIY